MRPAGKARFDEISFFVERNIFLQQLMELGSFGSGSHERHLASQYIPNLREFIQAGFSQEIADSCYSRVVLGGPYGPRFLFRVPAHCSEFQNLKSFARLAKSFLFVKYWTGRACFDSQRYERI